MLSRSQVIELMLPFAPSEHGFTPMGGGQVPYIKKSAIERRFHRVVPGWAMIAVHHIATENDAVILGGTLVLEDQNFSGVGAAVIQRYTKDASKQLVEVTPDVLARNTAKAYKQAASDLLPRCASIAGVGWYLREAPQQWKGKLGSEQGLREYLAFVQEQMRGWNPEAGAPKLGSGTSSGDERRIGSNQSLPEATKPEPDERRSQRQPTAANGAGNGGKTTEVLPLVEVTQVRVEKRVKGDKETWVYVFSDPLGNDPKQEYPVLDVSAFDAIGIDHRLWRAGVEDKPYVLQFARVFQLSLEKRVSAIGNQYYVIVGSVAEGMPL